MNSAVIDYWRLPENTGYRDTGCSLQPRCLECSLPRCRYDEDNRRGPQHAERDTQIQQMRTAGLTSPQIAATLGMKPAAVRAVSQRWARTRGAGEGSARRRGRRANAG